LTHEKYRLGFNTAKPKKAPLGFKGHLRKLSPQKILCSKCGESLYSGFELETPNETIQRNAGYCPKCGKKLGFETEALKITPVVSQQSTPETMPR
jgi:ribosomal protein S27AE